LSVDLVGGSPCLDPTAGTLSCLSNSLFFLITKCKKATLN
jgi:hypothetical protein